MKREEEQQSVCDGKRGEKMDANRIWQRQWWTTSSLSLSTSVTAVSGLCDLRKLGMVDIASKKKEGKVQAKMLHKSDTLVSCGHHTSPVTHGIAQAITCHTTHSKSKIHYKSTFQLSNANSLKAERDFHKGNQLPSFLSIPLSFPLLHSFTFCAQEVIIIRSAH